MIELCQLKKTYFSAGGDTVALDGIDLTVKDGAIFGVIGLSGAGKSTLVRCINLLERPTSGKVIIDGEDLTQVTRRRLLEIRRKIGMIFQGFNLLEQRTVEGNVRFPLEIERAHRRDRGSRKISRRAKKEEMKERVCELLDLVGLRDKAKAYPSELSGGQKQRVAIARALATRPKYLLCDEATSALDPNTTQSILDLLKEINRTLNVTVIVITHEMRVVESICTEVAVLDQSRVAEVGKVSDVFSFPQSQIARELILPSLLRSEESAGGDKLRLVFNGELSGAPVISDLAIHCGVSVNILYADTRHIGGKLFGHMVISLPEEKEKAEIAKRYLTERNVTFKEEV